MGAHPTLHPRDLPHSGVHIQSTRLIEITFSSCINQTMLHVYLSHSMCLTRTHIPGVDVSITVILVNISSIKGGIILSNANNYLKLIIKKTKSILFQKRN